MVQLNGCMNQLISSTTWRAAFPQISRLPRLQTSTPIQSTTLYYIHDPMCSWCWGFRPCWSRIQSHLDDSVHVQYLLGGLAADTDQPMSEALQSTIQNTWKKIQQHIPGTEFNFDFWTECQPRRSTYASCRAVIACRQQNPSLEEKMILAIQQAYYLHARNPSDLDTLVDCARIVGLDVEQFESDIQSTKTNQLLEKEIHFSEEIGATGYPSLILERDGDYYPLMLDYNDENVVLNQINNYLASNQGN